MGKSGMAVPDDRKGVRLASARVIHRAEDEPVGKRGTFAARSGLAALAAALMAENCTHELPGLVIAVGHGVGTIHGGSCRFRSPQGSGRAGGSPRGRQTRSGAMALIGTGFP